jgi:hypothetical protein
MAIETGNECWLCNRSLLSTDRVTSAWATGIRVHISCVRDDHQLADENRSEGMSSDGLTKSRSVRVVSRLPQLPPQIVAVAFGCLIAGLAVHMRRRGTRFRRHSARHRIDRQS